jgi:hypothetical protein
MHVYEWKTKGRRIKLLSSWCIPCGCVCVVLCLEGIFGVKGGLAHTLRY